MTKDPEISEAVDRLIVQANALVELGEFERAIADFEAAIKVDPQSPLGYLGRGVVYSNRREFKRSIADYGAAIRLAPRMAAAWRNRGRDFAATGKLRQAIADFTTAIELEPQDCRAYCDRATIYNRMGKFNLAIPDATTAIQLDTCFYLGHDARGWAHLGRGHQRVFTFWRHGNAASREHDYRQAMADFSEALRIQPAALDCVEGRARACRALGLKAGDCPRIMPPRPLAP